MILLLFESFNFYSQRYGDGLIILNQFECFLRYEAEQKRYRKPHNQNPNVSCSAFMHQKATVLKFREYQELYSKPSVRVFFAQRNEAKNISRTFLNFNIHFFYLITVSRKEYFFIGFTFVKIIQNK
jgi:hypothetical protein